MIRFRGWLARPHARRKPVEGARIPLSVSLDEDGEARAVAAQVETLRRAGVRYRDQAVLGRSHAAIDRIAAHLDAAGIPILHLGDMRERADVKALLGLLRIAVDGVAGEIRLTAEIVLDNMDPDVDEDDPVLDAMAERVFLGGLVKMGIRPEDTLPGPAA